MEHLFRGRWITTDEFAAVPPRSVFHRQLEKTELPDDPRPDRHILFRKKFTLREAPRDAKLFVTADDYCKLWINGRFAGQGPAPSYHFRYNYFVLDVASFLQPGENVIAAHTLYQGLINRVWQSGDGRHGLLLDLEIDGKTVLQSDESFLAARHTGFRPTGKCGYDTQFLEEYDGRAPEAGFEKPDFDDSRWENAVVKRGDDHKTVLQKSRSLVFEKIAPVKTEKAPGLVRLDFGGVYVGYLGLTARGRRGERVTVRCGQELNGDGSVRFDLRANCRYEEDWILPGGDAALDWFDYKAFRYAELLLPEGTEITEAFLLARHYPFALSVPLRKEYRGDAALEKVWELCVRSQRYGVQEVIQDCMEREKGFYLGDGCYSAMTNMILTKDDSMVRKMIDDAFAASFVTDTLVTCLDCSLMQEIAEYPLMLVNLVLWHARFTGDMKYLETNYPKVVSLLDAYRREYEKNGLLRDLDKWCVVEWPKNFQHGYDVDIAEGKVCREAHTAINAYYLAAVRAANRMASILGRKAYRDEAPLLKAFLEAFYLPEEGLFRDGEGTRHISLVGNAFPFGFGIVPDGGFDDRVLALYAGKGISSLSFFASFPMLMGFVRLGREDLLREALGDEGAWLRMIREGAAVTFEGWGRDTKWNTSLFHLTFSYAALFLAETDLKKLLI